MALLGVLASGRGSNFLAIADAIERHDLDAEIRVVISDREDAPVLAHARSRGLVAHYLPYDRSNRSEFEVRAAEILESSGCELIVLAGFMRILTPLILERFPDRIINIHPSLLPSFKGLDAQAQALRYGVKITGCSVHLVSEEMDAGQILGQRAVPVLEDDTVDTLSARILDQEHSLYPRVITDYAPKLAGDALSEAGAPIGSGRSEHLKNK
jgi:phosphoribosylglycinamide formyltransferase-1